MFLDARAGKYQISHWEMMLVNIPVRGVTDCTPTRLIVLSQSRFLLAQTRVRFMFWCTCIYMRVCVAQCVHTRYLVSFFFPHSGQVQDPRLYSKMSDACTLLFSSPLQILFAILEYKHFSESQPYDIVSKQLRQRLQKTAKISTHSDKTDSNQSCQPQFK